MPDLFPYVEKPSGEACEKVDTLETILRKADGMRRGFERDWEKNAAFLAGNEREFLPSGNRMNTRRVETPLESKHKTITHSILPLARQAASALRENVAQQIAVAANSSRRDIQAAELATDFLRFRDFEDRESEKRFHEILSCMVFGRVLRYTYFDPEASSLGWDGRDMPGAGDIVTETLNPLQFYIAPFDDASKDPPWIILTDVRDVEEINDTYHSDVLSEEYESVTRVSDKLLGNTSGGTAAAPPKRVNAAILKRLYHQPTPKYPKGRVFVWASGKLLQEGELPEGRMPFTLIDWFPVPGRLYPLPFITPLRGLQYEINTTLSQLIALKDRQLRGDLAVRGPGNVTEEYVMRQVGVSDEGEPIYEPTTQKVIRAGAGVQDWEFLRYDLNVGEAESLLLRLWNDMMQAAGIHESAIGQTPPRATTATQVMTLKESDLSGLSVFRAGFDLSYCKVAQQKLLLAHNHYKMPRMIRLVGDNLSVQTKSFFGSDLRGTTDVRPRTTPIITESMKAQMKREAAAAGLYGPYMGPEDMLAKLTALLNSGIPNAEADVDTALGGLTMEELRAIVAKINVLKNQSALLGAQAAVDQLMLQVAATEQQAASLMQAGNQTVPGLPEQWQTPVPPIQGRALQHVPAGPGPTPQQAGTMTEAAPVAGQLAAQ